MRACIPTVVIGLGNRLMSDEGIGPAVVSLLLAGCGAGVEVMDLGTNGFAVLHAVAGRNRAVIVDCACMGRSAGDWDCFAPSDVRSKKVIMRPGAHAADLLHTLELAVELGRGPQETLLFGIEPARVTPGLELSPELASQLPAYVAAVRMLAFAPDRTGAALAE